MVKQKTTKGTGNLKNGCTELNKEKTMVEVYRDTHKDIMMFKLKTNAKNVPDTLKYLIEKLKEQVELNEHNN